MPAGAKPRWINVTKPFDYHWPDRSALTAFTDRDLGDHFVKDELADFAVANGYATEGKADAKSRSSKGGPRRVRSRRKEPPAAKAADTGAAAAMGDADAADADRAADRPAMDHDAG